MQDTEPSKRRWRLQSYVIHQRGLNSWMTQGSSTGQLAGRGGGMEWVRGSSGSPVAAAELTESVGPAQSWAESSQHENPSSQARLQRRSRRKFAPTRRHERLAEDCRGYLR